MTTLIFNFTENETCMTTLLYSTIYLSDSIWLRNSTIKHYSTNNDEIVNNVSKANVNHPQMVGL